MKSSYFVLMKDQKMDFNIWDTLPRDRVQSRLQHCAMACSLVTIRELYELIGINISSKTQDYDTDDQQT